ncbi:MAG: hypothetical protein M3O09_00330 [Acidobacteriota bacterium]|nr:hypothetical protein [Acidobacteriota bacterium]
MFARFGQLGNSATLAVTPAANGANAYCAIGDVYTGQVSDGPAALPSACMYTGIDGTPTPGNIILVPQGGSVTTALTIAKCGDVIKLAAGASFAPFNLPAKTCDPLHWIQIRSDAPDTSLPPEGTRINPSYAGVASLPDRPPFAGGNGNVMAQVVAVGRGYAITTSQGANFYRIGPGIEITRQQGTGLNYALVEVSRADHVILDRVWNHGSPVLTDESKRGIDLSGSTNTAVVDSYFNDFKCIAGGLCTEAQAILAGIFNTPQGPHKIFNNFLEASTENILFGGGGSTATVPADIEIRRNHLYRPPSWNVNSPNFIGQKYIVKNHMEFKNARRTLFEENYLENTWGGFSQTGFTILMTPRGDWASVEDITVRNVHVLHVGSGFQLVATTCAASTHCSTPTADSVAAARFSIHDVLIEDMNSALYTGSNLVAQISSGFTKNPPLNNVSLDHITVLNRGNAGNEIQLGTIPTNPQPTMGPIAITNSIFFTSRYPVWSTGLPSICTTDGQPLKTFNACFASFNITDNLVIGYDAPGTQQWGPWPDGNAFPIDPTVVFVNYNGGWGGDYHVAAPYQNSGLDGKDLGADIAAILKGADTAQ